MGLKKIFVLLFLFVSVYSFGQQVQFPTTYGVGYKRTGGDSLLWIPSDTLTPISQLIGRTHLARKGTTVYYWNGSVWVSLSGIASLSAIGSSPNANGATITGSVLNLEPASASFGGVVTTGTQSFAGAKTFANDVTLSGNVTLTGTTNSSLTGSNARIPSHTASNITFTNASLTSIGSANNGGVSGGHVLLISNETGNNITIVNNYSGAAAGEKIYVGSGIDIVIKNHNSFWLQYNSNASAWVFIGNAGAYINNQIASKQTANAWFDSLRLKNIRLASEDSALYDAISADKNLIGIYESGRMMNIRDIDTVTSLNDDWISSINVNSFIERITRLDPTRSSQYRGNFMTKQIYQADTRGGFVSSNLGGDLGYSTQAQLSLSNKTTITSGRVVINGGNGTMFDAVPALIGNVTTQKQNDFTGTIMAARYWAAVTAYHNISSGDTIENFIAFNSSGFSSGAKILSHTGLSIPIDAVSGRVDLSWGVYSPDVTGGNSYNLFGGHVGIGTDGFGTHLSPTFKSSAALQINSHSRGFLTSRMTTTEMNAISSPDSSLFIWNSDSLRYFGYKPGTGWKGVSWTSDGGSAPTLQQVLTAGSTLTTNNTINSGANLLSIGGTNASADVISIQNTNGGSGLAASSSGNNYGINGTSSGGYGVYGVSTTGPAIRGWTTNGQTASEIEANSSNTNSATPTLKLIRTTSGTAANGIGSAINFYIEKDNGASNTVAGQIIYKLTDVTAISPTSQLDLIGINSGSTETFANFQTSGIVRVNNLADTLATKAYARSVGGGSGTVNTGASGKAAYYPSAGTTVDDFAAVDYALSGTNVKITTQNTTDVGLEIKGVSSQSGNYLNVSSSASTADLMRFTSSGELWINKTTDKGNYDIQATRGIFVDAVPSNNEGLYMIATSGAGNYFVIQNSGGTVWQSVAGGGMLYDIATSGGGSIKFSPSLTGMANITTTGLHVGSSTTAATSKLQVGGSFGTKYDSTAVGITLDATYSTVGVTATGQTITLPTAASIAGREYTIVLTATGTCTIATTSSQLIAHATTYTLSAQDKYVTVKSTGANWIVIANN